MQRVTEEPLSDSHSEVDKDPLLDAYYAYAEDLQLQEVLEASLIDYVVNDDSGSSLSSSPSSLVKVESNPPPVLIKIEKVTESSSSSSQCFCEICAEAKYAGEMLTVNGVCSHSFCAACISKYVATRIQDNTVVVPCPGLDCRGVVELDTCRGILPQDVLSRWERAQCEAQFLESQKFYCPYRDCSGMLLNDGGVVVQEAECPYCHRLFCAHCYVPWHTGVTCEEYLSLNEDERGRDDLMVRELANEKKWGRCPNCKFFVERTHGCPHIVCRCKSEFCYGCGAPWDGNHGGCSRS